MSRTGDETSSTGGAMNGSGTPSPAQKGTTMLVLGLAVASIIAVAIGIAVSGPKSPSTAAAGTSTSTPTATLAPGSSTTSSVPTTTVASSTFPTPTTQPLQTVAVAPTCAPAGNTKRVVYFTKAPPPCIGRSSVWDATFDTSVGPIVVQMDAAKSFAAVNNFVFLSQWRYYDGTFFHRVITGFVVQGGDPTGTGTGGPHGYPGYTFTGNTPPATCTSSPGPACYQTGDLAMANTGTPTTNGSQFFFVLPGGGSVLDSEPNYTDFGHVVNGMAVLDKIGAYGSASGTPKVRVYLLSVSVSEVKS